MTSKIRRIANYSGSTLEGTGRNLRGLVKIPANSAQNQMEELPR